MYPLRHLCYLSRVNLSLRSPAKINLHLSVFEKQTDGYHRVETSMVKVSLHDDIQLSVTEGNEITVEVTEPFKFLSGEQNLAYKAANFFLQATKQTKNIFIQIQKKIPLGAGLGGGSGNAGVVLSALNKINGHPLTEKELMILGRQLGADVPFFTQPHDFGFLKDRGDQIVESFEFPALPILIVYPNIHASTPEVYKRLGRSLTWDGAGAMEGPCHRKITAWKDVEFLLKKGNDLQSVTEQMHPEIGTIRRQLQEYGAYFSQMSGSGASVFGLFDDENVAKKAKQYFDGKSQCFLVTSGICE